MSVTHNTNPWGNWLEVVVDTEAATEPCGQLPGSVTPVSLFRLKSVFV